MDPNTVVLEISSDEDVGWDSHDGRGITDGVDDHNWIAELLDEVNREDCDFNCGYDDEGDDSDEVVLVSEVLPAKKPKKKLKSKSSSLLDLDDDCVVLDHDPDKPVEVRNDNPIDRGEDDDSDDLLVVSEKGQVACRDYPHPRHLCIKFPFSSTPNQSHCNQCYCYVCDSLAPCVYWGKGSASLDHCCATDKDEFWKLERRNSKNYSNVIQPVPKVADPSLSNQLPPMNLVPPASPLVQTHNQVLRPEPTRVCPISSNFGIQNNINQTRSPFLLSRNKYQPNLISQHLIRTNNCGSPRDRVHHSPFHGPVFKRTGVAPTANQYSYSSYRDNYKNPCRPQDYPVGGIISGPSKYSGSSQSNTVNTSGLFSPPNLTSSTVNSFPEEPLPFQPEFSSNTQFDFSPNFHSEVENPNLFQPHVLPSPQNYSVPAEPPGNSPNVTPTIEPSFVDNNINWARIETNQQTGAESSLLEGSVPTNDSSLAPVSAGLVDYQYDNWIFDNQPCEPGSIDVPGSFGLNEFSPEPAFIGTGTIFDF